MKKLLMVLVVMAIVASTYAVDVDFIATDNQDGTVTITYTINSGAVTSLALNVDTDIDITDCIVEDPSFDVFFLSQTTPDEITFPSNSFCISMFNIEGTSDSGRIVLTASGVGAGQMDINTLRGGVTNTDGQAMTTNLPIPIDTMPQECVKSTAPFYADWLDLGKPDCWCYPKNCKGDADGRKIGNPLTGYAHVTTDDLNILISAWNIKEPPRGPGILSVPGAICADFDRYKIGNPLMGYAYVSTNEISMMVACWNVKEPPKGPGVPDCDMTDYNFFITP